MKFTALTQKFFYRQVLFVRRKPQRESLFRSRSFRNGLSLALLLLSESLIFAQVCSAENYLLKSSQAMRRAEEYSISSSRRDRSRRLVSADPRSQYQLKEGLKLDSVDGLLSRQGRDSAEYVSYRGVAYLSYSQDVVDLTEFRETEQTAAAEKTFVFETLKLTDRYIFRPAFRGLYEQAVVHLRKLRDYTTFGLVNDSGGKFGVQRGTSEDERLLEFKIHASARYGIEPRLIFRDDLMLRYQVLDSELWLEFRRDF